MKKLIIILLAISISACSTMQPPRYSSSVDNVVALRELGTAKLNVSNLTQSAKFSANCRLMGPIEPADGLSMPDFIAKAFNDEFKLANIYSESGTTITGDITKIQFSSISGLTNGFWDIGLVLGSSNGNSLVVENKFDFKSGFDAITACNATADALSPAIQDLIYKTVTSPEFNDLIR